MPDLLRFTFGRVASQAMRGERRASVMLQLGMAAQVRHRLGTKRCSLGADY